MPTRCVTFDLDDTLWDCKSVIDHAELKLYQWLQSNRPAITDQHALSELVQLRTAYMRINPDLQHDLGKLRKQWLASLAEQFELDQDWIEPAFEHFLDARNQVELFPNVLPALEQLAGGYTLGVITNGNAEVHRIKDLKHLFHFAHSSALAGVSKPDPEIFQQALEIAGVAGDEMVYVGDDPEKDIIGASRAGLRTIWYNPEGRAPCKGMKPDAVMTNFSELVTIVQSL